MFSMHFDLGPTRLFAQRHCIKPVGVENPTLISGGQRVLNHYFFDLFCRCLKTQFGLGEEQVAKLAEDDCMTPLASFFFKQSIWS